MVNPFSDFSIYNRIYKYKAKYIINRNIVKGDICILMRVQITKPYHHNSCNEYHWREEIDIEDIIFKIPNELVKKNIHQIYQIKPEYKSIINNINKDNFPSWFEIWDEPLNKCIGSGDCGYQHRKIIYTPLDFSFISSYDEEI